MYRCACLLVWRFKREENTLFELHKSKLEFSVNGMLNLAFFYVLALLWKQIVPCYFNLYCILSRNKKKDVTIWVIQNPYTVCDHWMITFNWPAPFRSDMLQLLWSSVSLLQRMNEYFPHFEFWLLLVCIMLMPTYKNIHLQVDILVAWWWDLIMYSMTHVWEKEFSFVESFFTVIYF